MLGCKSACCQCFPFSLCLALRRARLAPQLQYGPSASDHIYGKLAWFACLVGNLACLRHTQNTNWLLCLFVQNLELVEAVRSIAQRKGCTPGQLALAWVHAQGDDVFTIPGTRRIKYAACICQPGNALLLAWVHLTGMPCQGMCSFHNAPAQPVDDSILHN